MSEIKSAIMYFLFSASVIGLAIILPRLTKAVAILKKNISETALNVAQGILIAYAIIFGVIIPVSTEIGTWLMH